MRQITFKLPYTNGRRRKKITPSWVLQITYKVQQSTKAQPIGTEGPLRDVVARRYEMAARLAVLTDFKPQDQDQPWT